MTEYVEEHRTVKTWGLAHSTLANSNITINVNGTWLTGNAMRFTSTSATAGTMNANIGPNGVVDAGTQASGSLTATNMVFYNALNGQVFYNITGNCILKKRVTHADLVFPIDSGGTYSPVKLNNSGPADLIGVGVKSGLDYPTADITRIVNKQFSVVPATAGVPNLTIGLGWITPDQGSNFNPAGSVVQRRYNVSSWAEIPAAMSGSGSVTVPYYAVVSGITIFGTFIVANATATALPLYLMSIAAIQKDNNNLVTWVTTNEMNLDEFEIQRSNDGVQFTTIGNAVARNNSVNAYVFTDVAPSNGSSYYWLKMINKDGSFTSSKIFSVWQTASIL